MNDRRRPLPVPQTFPSHPAVCIEPLEARELLAVVVTVTQRGRLNIFAPPGDTAGDVVEVVPANGFRDLQVYVNGVLAPLRPNADQPDIVNRIKIHRIVADMGAGDDEVYIGVRKGTPRPFRNRLFNKATLIGGDGNDILQGGPQVDLIIGGAGDDIIYGDRGNDVIFAGSGNDQVFGENGRDIILGQDGNDFLHGGGNQDAVYGMAGADAVFGDEDRDFVNAGGDPGDTHDRNERPGSGETKDVKEYVRKLILLAVPDQYQAAASS